MAKSAKNKSIVEYPTKLPALPFSMGDRGAYIRKAWVAVEMLGKDFIASLYYAFSDGMVHVCAVGKHDIDYDHAGVKPFYVDGHHTMQGPTVLALKTHLQWLKVQALRGGATPDAIRYMSSVIKLTKQEEGQMAKAATNKKTTAKPAKADKPVGKGGKLAGAKKGGNPEALAKAREAAAERNAEVHKQKLTVLAKVADVKLRGGRLAKFTAIAKTKPKTVGAAIGLSAPGIGDDKETYTIDMGALRGMEKRGHIQIG